MLDAFKETAPELAPLIALLACPFCGGEAGFRENNGKYSIACINKGHACMVGSCTQTFSTIHGAVFAWNMRIGQATAASGSEEQVCHRVDAV